MPPGDVAPLLLVSMMTLVAGAVLIFRGPIGKAIARRLEGNSGENPEIEARLQDLEARALAAEQERTELLERLEFAERMLLSVKDQPRELPR